MLRLAALALLLSGCVSTMPEPLNSADGRADINGRATLGPAEITLLNAPRRAVLNLHVAPDVTTWIDPSTRTLRAAPTDSIRAVTFLDRPRGAFKGAALAVFGAYAYGYTTRPRDGRFDIFPSGYLTVLLSAIAAPVGAMIGSEVGDGDVYRRSGLAEVGEPVPDPASPVRLRDPQR